MRKLYIFSVLMIVVIQMILSCNKEMSDTKFVISAGDNRTIHSYDQSVTLTGIIKSGEAKDMKFLWTLISGPNVPVFSNQDSLKTIINNLITGTYIFQLQVTNGETIQVSTVSVIVLAPNTYTITLQPGKYTGQDAEVCYVPNLYLGNDKMGHDSLLRISYWTYYAQNGTEGATRSFIKFSALDTIPANATIISAKLSLYALSWMPYSSYMGNSYYPGSPYNTYGDNKLWVQRVVANWDQSSITFNNQPSTTEANEAEIPASTSQYNYNVSDLDVTQLVKDIKTSPNKNFGFCLRLQNESIYRSMGFDASETKADSSTAPKLVISYRY